MRVVLMCAFDLHSIRIGALAASACRGMQGALPRKSARSLRRLATPHLVFRGMPATNGIHPSTVVCSASSLTA